MRRIDLILEAARRQTDNVEYDASSGLSQDQLIQFANDGQDDLVEAILSEFPLSFTEEIEISLVADQEEYELPRDCFMGSRVIKVEYSHSGLSRDYYKLDLGTISERVAGYSADPSFYIRKNKSVLLQPKPQKSGALIRVTYQKAFPRLDYRLARVGSVTTSGSSITALTLDTSYPIFDTQLLEEEYVCIVDKNGLVKMQAIPLTAVDVSTGVCTIDTFSFQTGESIAANDYVVRGKYTTTHSYLTDNCERYLYQYVSWKILKRDSSNDSPEQGQELEMTKMQVVRSFAIPEQDTSTVPILDSQFLMDDLI